MSRKTPLISYAFSDREHIVLYFVVKRADLAYTFFMILEHTNYRHFLKALLAERITKNPSYSLRSFAKTLNTAPSMITAVLQGKKNLSPERAIQVGTRLNLNERDLEYFCLLVQLEIAKSEILKSSLQEKVNAFRPKDPIFELSVDHFKLISDWYHLPILEMSGLSGFEFTPKNIASRLNISTAEAQAAVERLERLELLEKSKYGRFQKAKNRLLVDAPTPNLALRSYHKSMLNKAEKAMETYTPDARVNATETFVFSPSQIGEAKRLTRTYLEKMIELASQNKNKNQEVFHLGVQMFPLTQSSEK